MDWRFVLQMGSLGLIIGVVDLFALLPIGSMPLWLGIGFIWVAVAVRRVPKAPFQHVLVASLLAGFLWGDVQAIFWPIYLDNHPAIVDAEALPRLGLVLTGLIWGALFGLFAGLVAMLATRSARRAQSRMASREDVQPLGAHMDLTHPGSGGLAGGLAGAAIALDSDDSEE